MTTREVVMEQHTDGWVPMAMWGKDHWSTLAYLGTRLVEGLQPERDRMRVDVGVHPQHANRASRSTATNGKRHPTRLNNGCTVDGHDDWSCLDDAVAEGLLTETGTGVNPYYALTSRGGAVVAALRQHKRDGGGFATFKPPEPIRSPRQALGDVRALATLALTYLGRRGGEDDWRHVVRLCASAGVVSSPLREGETCRDAGEVFATASEGHGGAERGAGEVLA